MKKRDVRLFVVATIILTTLFVVPLIDAYGISTKVEKAPFEWTAPGGCAIYQVVIKAGTNEFVYVKDETGPCYEVTGIGTPTARATRIGQPSPQCKDISHVTFMQDCATTAVTITKMSVVHPWIVYIVIITLIAITALRLILIIRERFDQRRYSRKLQERLDDIVDH